MHKAVVGAISLMLVTPVGAWGQKAGSDWDQVKAVKAGTTVRVRQLKHRAEMCDLVLADDQALTCAYTRTVFFVPRARRWVFVRSEVTEVRLARPMLSSLVGAGIGVGAGVGTAYGVGSGYSNHEDDGLLRLLFGLLGGGFGAGVGRATDFMGGPVIYRAP